MLAEWTSEILSLSLSLSHIENGCKAMADMNFHTASQVSFCYVC